MFFLFSQRRIIITAVHKNSALLLLNLGLLLLLDS